MQKIIPHLWYDKEALEAATWYVSLFEDSRIENTSIISDTPSGDAQVVSFVIAGFSFSAISAGPLFSMNPAVSLMISCQTRQEVDRLYKELKQGATILMPLDTYPYSAYYVWLQDRYGLNWQLMLTADSNINIPRIRPVMLFAGDACGKAQEAMDYYAAVFPETKIGFVNHYGKGEAQDERAKINYAEISIYGTPFITMDHGAGGEFSFNEAISFMVPCRDQKEIDYFWEKLSFVPEAEQCGWLKDQFGVSWQIVPENMEDIFVSGTPEEAERVTKAFMKMKKLDIALLEQAKMGMITAE